jgi:hypothetical protein
VPRNGRAYPRDARANDVLHWETRLLVPDAGQAAARLQAEGAEFISPGAVGVGSTQAGVLGVQVRDPDGHVLQLVER